LLAFAVNNKGVVLLGAAAVAGIGLYCLFQNYAFQRVTQECLSRLTKSSAELGTTVESLNESVGKNKESIQEINTLVKQLQDGTIISVDSLKERIIEVLESCADMNGTAQAIKTVAQQVNRLALLESNERKILKLVLLALLEANLIPEANADSARTFCNSA
jgi:hypothetical protein